MANVIGEFVAKIGADMKDFNQGITGAEKNMAGFASNVKKHSRAIGIGMTAMGGAIVAGLGLATKSAMDFTAGMREVNTMIGLGEEEFEAFSTDTLDLAKTLGINAVDATAALYQAISAGVPKDNALTFLEVAAKAAIGGVTDTETAVDGLTTVINAFKIPMEDAQKVADIMFTTVKGGKTTFEELSSKMFNVAPIASATGIAFEEVSAAIATMTKQGFPTAQATTAIRQAIVQLQKPTQEMEDMIKSLGFETGEAMIAELGFGETLERLKEATGGSNAMLAKMFSSTEAIGAVFALTGENAKTYTTDLLAMTAATEGAGASTEAFNEIEKSSSRQLEKAKESIKAVAIEIGGNLLPQLIPLIQKVGEVVGNVSAWIAENPQLTATITKIVAVVGVMLTILGPLLIILPGLIAALPLVAGAFALLLGPVGLIIIAITALVAAGIWLIQNWEAVESATVRIWGNIVGFIGNAVNKVIDIINGMIAAVNKVTGIVGIKAIGTLGKVDFGMPKMHGGGIVPGLPGQDVPIMAQAGEKITPAGDRAAPTIIVNIEGSVVSERDIAEIVREQFYLTQNRTQTLDFR